MTNEHEANAPFAADLADLAKTIVKRQMMYMDARPSADVVRSFVSGLDLAVRMVKGTSPLAEADHRRLHDLPDGDCSEAIWELKPLLVTLLSEIDS